MFYKDHPGSSVDIDCKSVRVKKRENSWESRLIIQVKHDGGFDGGGSRNGEERSDSGCVSKMETTWYTSKLDEGC